MKNTTKIYLVSNINSDPNTVYIGKTKNTRKYNHKNIFGDNIKYDIIDEIKSLNRKDWEPLETKWIQHYRNLGYNVVNKNNGGGGPKSCNKETKQKIRNKHLGIKHSEETKQKMSKAKIGIPRSEETKQKMRKSKSKEHAFKFRKPILQYDLQGNFVKEYDSYTSAKNITKINGINNVLVGISKTAGNYIWKHK
jgi:hypothetical protein